MAATSWNRAGYSTCSAAREMAMTPDLQRLAQRLEHAPVELRQLVEEQHAAMREADLARPCMRTSADDGAGGRGVVRRAKRAPAVFTRLEAAAAGRRNGGHVQRLVAFERRQQSRQPLRQHALAGARRPDEQQAVCARRGDQQCALGRGLAAHVGEIGVGDRLSCSTSRCWQASRGMAGSAPREANSAQTSSKLAAPNAPADAAMRASARLLMGTMTRWPARARVRGRQQHAAESAAARRRGPSSP